MVPLPFDAPVTAVGTCVQEKVAPTGVLDKARLVAVPEQIVVEATTVALGVSFKTKGTLTGAAQPVGVNVIVYEPAVLVEKETVPVPLFKFKPAGTEEYVPPLVHVFVGVILLNETQKGPP